MTGALFRFFAVVKIEVAQIARPKISNYVSINIAAKIVPEEPFLDVCGEVEAANFKSPRSWPAPLNYKVLACRVPKNNLLRNLRFTLGCGLGVGGSETPAVRKRPTRQRRACAWWPRQTLQSERGVKRGPAVLRNTASSTQLAPHRLFFFSIRIYPNYGSVPALVPFLSFPVPPQTSHSQRHVAADNDAAAPPLTALSTGLERPFVVNMAPAALIL